MISYQSSCESYDGKIESDETFYYLFIYLIKVKKKFRIPSNMMGLTNY